MNLVPWAIVGLLLGAFLILWTISKSRIEGLSEDLETAFDTADEIEKELYAEIAKLKKPPPPWPLPDGVAMNEKGQFYRLFPLAPALVEAKPSKPPPFRPPAQYKPTHRRPWPSPDGMRLGYRTLDTGTDIVDRSVYPRTDLDDKVALARLAMDCSIAHPADCDCVTTYRLLEHEASLGEGD